MALDCIGIFHVIIRAETESYKPPKMFLHQLLIGYDWF